MAKYDPLIEHLRNTNGEQTLLTLNSIERILGSPLPPSARQHAAFWANSSGKDAHSWAHAWQAIGWKARVRFANGTVEFTRFVVASPSLLNELRPKAMHNVMDLVRAVGIDVTAWAYTDDQPYAVPQSNPKFCYDWSFGSPQEGYVICVWYRDLFERKGRVVYDCDIGSHTRKLKNELGRPNLTPAQRGRLVKQIKRSEAFEAVVANSFFSAQPLRLILNLGDTRSEEEIADSASAVSERELDADNWYVHTLDQGDALIVRGEPASMPHTLTPADDFPPESPGADDSWRLGQIRRRQGQPEFRAKLLEAYERRCAVTGTRVEPLLEAAHIIPHSEGTDYRTSNGLLLRADIHTLYDLYLLSIDERGAIHLSRTVMHTDYGPYQDKTVRFPVKFSQYPSPTNLRSRHQRFLDMEMGRL